MTGYYLTWETLASLGISESAIASHIVDMDATGLWLNIDQADNDKDGIPDFLESLTPGGDLVLNPSQDFVVG